MFIYSLHEYVCTVGVKLKFPVSLVSYNAYSAIVSLSCSVYTQQIG